MMAVIQLPEQRTGFEGVGTNIVNAYLGAKQGETQRMGVENQKAQAAQAHQLQQDMFDEEKKQNELSLKKQLRTESINNLKTILNLLEQKRGNVPEDKLGELDKTEQFTFDAITSKMFENESGGVPTDLLDLPPQLSPTHKAIRDSIISHIGKYAPEEVQQEWLWYGQLRKGNAGISDWPRAKTEILTTEQRLAHKKTTAETGKIGAETVTVGKHGLYYDALSKTAGVTTPKQFTEADILVGYREYVNKYMTNQTSDITMMMIGNLKGKDKEAAIASLDKGDMLSNAEYRALFPTLLSGGISAYLGQDQKKRYSIIKAE